MGLKKAIGVEEQGKERDRETGTGREDRETQRDTKTNMETDRRNGREAEKTPGKPGKNDFKGQWRAGGGDIDKGRQRRPRT